jgi:hypothetical protein
VIRPVYPYPGQLTISQIAGHERELLWWDVVDVIGALFRLSSTFFLCVPGIAASDSTPDDRNDTPVQFSSVQFLSVSDCLASFRWRGYGFECGHAALHLEGGA